MLIWSHLNDFPILHPDVLGFVCFFLQAVSVLGPLEVYATFVAHRESVKRAQLAFNAYRKNLKNANRGSFLRATQFGLIYPLKSLVYSRRPPRGGGGGCSFSNVEQPHKRVSKHEIYSVSFSNHKSHGALYSHAVVQCRTSASHGGKKHGGRNRT